MTTSLEQLLQATQHLLARRSAAPEGLTTILPGVLVARSTSQKVQAHALYRTALGAVLQGTKEVLAGETALHYRAGEALLTRVPVPARGAVIVGSKARPFVAITVELDPVLLKQVLHELPAAPASYPELAAFSVLALEVRVLDCLMRMVDLAGETAQAQAFLLPGLMRELIFRLLLGPAGPTLAAMADPLPRSRRLAGAIRKLQRGFRQPMDVAALAAAAGMSPALFYRRFRETTSLSPLQYHKQLRLLEARRLLRAGNTSVTAVAYSVGYESASQFSREFRRFFGQPPKANLPAN